MEIFWPKVPCFIPDLQLSSLAAEYELNPGSRDEQGGPSDRKTLASSGLELGTPTMPLSNKPRGRGRPSMTKSQDLGVKLTMKEGRGESMFLAEPKSWGLPPKVKEVFGERQIKTNNNVSFLIAQEQTKQIELDAKILHQEIQALFSR